MRATRALAVAAAALVLQCAGAGVSAQQVDAVEIVWAGTYTVGGAREVEDPTSPMGARLVAGGVRPLEETLRVPAVVGTRFGVGFVPRGEPAGARAPLQALWRFPERGLSNPHTRTTTFEWRMALESCTIGRAPWCMVGYPLRHDWELVPGRWTLEIRDGTRTLAERTFELYLP